jgi:signal transduction histidine kinase
MCVDMIKAKAGRLVSGGAAPTKGYDELAASIDRASGSIQKLVGNLRSISAGTSARPERVDLHTCICNTLFLLTRKIKTSDVTVDDLSAADRHFVMGKPAQLERVFANLISNACDAMDGCGERKVSIVIEAHSRDDTDYWNTTIADTGRGIPEEDRERIFESFYTTKSGDTGTGLGLSIVRGIVGEHRGLVELESKPGRGATFSVLLPRCEQA